MSYELFMGGTLAEARVALAEGNRPIAAVAVVNDAIVARTHDRVQLSNDPTAHAVVVALREAARKLGSAKDSGRSGSGRSGSGRDDASRNGASRNRASPSGGVHAKAGPRS